MSTKQLGYLFLIIGLTTMLAAFVFILLVFLGRRDPIMVLNIAAPSIPLNSFMPQIPNAQSLGIQVPQTNQSIELIKAESFNKMLNLGINLFFMGFIINFGYKLSSLGVQFINGYKDKPSNQTQQNNSTGNIN